jgi:hypothetical protein
LPGCNAKEARQFHAACELLLRTSRKITMKTKQPVHRFDTETTSSFESLDARQLDAVLGGCACGCAQANCNCANGSCGQGAPAAANQYRRLR